MNTFEVWIEGYAASGNRSGARLLDIIQANTFTEAVIEAGRGDGSFNPDNLTFWGCRSFDNEEDARKSYGQLCTAPSLLTEAFLYLSVDNHPSHMQNGFIDLANKQTGATLWKLSLGTV